MRILVLGCGTIGPIICRELVKHPRVSEVVCADIEFNRVKNFIEKYGSHKMTALQVDVGRPEDLRTAIRGVDIVINAVSGEYNFEIMKACIENKVCYQDLALGYTFNGKEIPLEKALEIELSLDEKFKKNNCIALINTGEAPGLSDLIAGYCADKMDRVFEVRIKDCEAIKAKGALAICPPDTLWFDIIEEPIIYRDGRFIRLKPFSEEEIYLFPDPVGPQPCYQHLHEEVVTLPHFVKGIKYIETKLCGPFMPFAKSLYEIGLLETKPIDVEGVKVAPIDVLVAVLPPPLSLDEVERRVRDGTLVDDVICLLLDIKGEEDGSEIEYTYYTIMNLKEATKRMSNAASSTYIVGASAAAFTELLIEGKIETKGVVPPEALAPEEKISLIGRLKEKGIKFHEVIKKPL